MKKHISKIVLVAIILLASILRLYSLGAVPVSPDWDEVALGYNAYSILQTGKDEYGVPFPLVLQSFGDYKPALYIYFALPSIALLGLNTFAVRFPSAILGILTVSAAYFLIKEIFTWRDKKNAADEKQSTIVALLSTFLLAISPWHIQFSRVAFETNAGLALNIFGALFFLKGLKKPWLLSLSVFFFGCSLYVYQSEKVFVPLLLLLLIGIYRKFFFALPKKALVGFFLTGVIICMPLVFSLLTDHTYLSRAKGVSIFSGESKLLDLEKDKLLKAKEEGDIIGQIFSNRRVTYGKEIINGYMSHYDINWLFVTGDLERHHAPSMGLLYFVELPFLLLGIYFLFFSRFPKEAKLLIFGWFLIAPIPASVTQGVPHAVRTLNFLPTFQIFTAIGLLSAMLYISRWNYHFGKLYFKYLLFSIFVLVALFNFGYYLNQYFVQQNYFTSKEWQYGYADAVAEIKKIEGNYDKIVIANQSPLDQSYIFFLYYLHYPPAVFQSENGNKIENKTFSKYEFRPIHWSKEQKSANILYVGREIDFSPKIKSLKEIKYLDGKTAIKIVEGE